MQRSYQETHLATGQERTGHRTHRTIGECKQAEGQVQQQSLNIDRRTRDETEQLDSGFAYYNVTVRTTSLTSHSHTRAQTTSVQTDTGRLKDDRPHPTMGLTVRVGISNFVLLGDSSGESSTNATCRRPST